MKKTVIGFVVSAFIIAFSSIVDAQTTVSIGPRLTGNLNIYNQQGLTGTWNGLGIGVGGNVDVSFSQYIGLMVNLTAFDMKSFSNSQTAGQVTTKRSLSLSYFTFDPLFKFEISGFYMVGGPSLGIKLASSGEVVQTQAGAAPNTQPLSLDTKTLRFDFAAGTGYSFRLSPNMSLGTDFLVYIPITDTYNFPGLSNSVLSLKLGTSLKFRL